MAVTRVVAGVQQNNPDTQPFVARGGRQGDQMVSELHGRYYEQTYRRNMFSVASQAVATTTVGLATTYTGLCLANPKASQVNLVLNIVSMMQSVIQATQVEAFALAYGFNTSTDVTLTVAATPQSRSIGSGVSAVARAATSATLPTAPLYGDFFTNTGTATADSTGVQMFDLGGSVILMPGANAFWVTPAQASVAGMWFSFCWEEVPV